MLKFYCLDEEYNLIPSTRIYYYQEGKDIAFSGTYTNFGSGEMAKSAYSFTIAMMCYVFYLKFEDFKEIEGMSDERFEQLKDEILKTEMVDTMELLLEDLKI